LLLALGVVLASVMLVKFGAHTRRQTLTQADKAFAVWRQQQNKLYATPEELKYRSGVFAQNFAKVAHMNQVYTHKSILNRFADLTEEEFLVKHTGLRYTGNEVRNTEKHQASTLGQQASVDWRTKGAVNPMKDQGQCGSCWAFSATSAIESHVFLKNGTLWNLSEQQVVDCSGSYGNYGCNGGWMDYAFKYVIDYGQEQTSDYPYTARDGTCKYDATKVKARFTGFYDIPQNDCKGLLSAITQQPVSVAIAANAIMFYSSGIFAVTNCGTSLNHGVTAVGYGTQDSKNFYIVRNSWGAGWGEQGYIRMSRDVQTDSGICGICMVSSYPTTK